MSNHLQSSPNDHFFLKLKQEVYENAVAYRTPREILIAFGSCRRRNRNVPRILKELKKRGLHCASLGHHESLKIDNKVPIYRNDHMRYSIVADYGPHSKAIAKIPLREILIDFEETRPLYHNDSVETAFKRFQGELLDHLPVIDNQTRKCIGTVARIDVVSRETPVQGTLPFRDTTAVWINDTLEELNRAFRNRRVVPVDVNGGWYYVVEAHEIHCRITRIVMDRFTS